MNRTAIVALIFIMGAGGVAFGQRNEKLSLTDNDGTPTSGTYNSDDTFTLDISIRFRGYDASGLSYWFEVQNALAPNISITNVTYFTFLDPNQSGPNPALFNSTSGAHSGYMTETRDLGATDTGMSPGTYLVASIQFTLTGAAPGTYQLKSTTLSPRGSEISDTTFSTHFLGASSYRITVSPTGTFSSVPEPTTLTLLALAAGACGVAGARRSRIASAKRGGVTC